MKSPIADDDFELAKEHLSSMAVGFVEVFDVSLRRFAKQFRWKNIRHVSRQVAYWRPNVKLSQRDIDVLLKLNKYDAALYKWAIERAGWI